MIACAKHPQLARELLRQRSPNLHVADNVRTLGLRPTASDGRMHQGGRTPLHYALRSDSVDLVSDLLARGADVRTRTEARQSAPSPPALLAC
jgi:ankyrin repeat protein